MATAEQLDRIEGKLTDWIGAANASTLLQLIGARPESTDPHQNPVVSISLIEDLHDTLVHEWDHELADAFLDMTGHPGKFWVPSCSNAA